MIEGLVFVCCKNEKLRYNKLMDEISRYAVGLDVGTSNVRAVVASIAGNGNLNVIGYAEAPTNSGMRRGVVANLSGPAQAIDQMLGEVERMSGYEVNSATVSINGAHILSTQTKGMIAVGGMEHEINADDLARVEDQALRGWIPANQHILETVPLQFMLDGQSGIKDPIGMTGSRLEMQANVVSALTPNYENLKRVAEAANVTPEQIIPSAQAAARAVLSDRQRENGVAVVDFGAATTGVAIFEESDLRYIGVVPVGSNNITIDLATVLAVDMEVAEEIKRRFATCNFGAVDSPVVIRWKGKEIRFEREQIDEVVKARLEEIFELVRKELKKAHYEQRLPEGMVLTGGGARIRDLDKFVRETLNMSVKIGVPMLLNGVGEAIQKPEYAAAVGLMLKSAEGGQMQKGKTGKKGKKAKEPGMLKKILSKFA